MSSPGHGLQLESGVAAETGTGDQHQDVGQEDFDALLPPNVLETLVDFDFACTDLSSSPDADARPQSASDSPKVSGRKRSFTQSGNWDNLGPKALAELSASLLAGMWENPTAAKTQAAAGGLDAPNAAVASGISPHLSVKVRGEKIAPRSAGTGRTCGGGVVEQGIIGGEPQTPAPGVVAAAAGGKVGKGRRTSAAGGTSAKRPLNPDRMERKASREKRRREEVNEKFDQLLQVLEEAEATSGLEPPVDEDGQAVTSSCINGRRVEVLSRTITVLKKLLRERSGGLGTHPGSVTRSTCGEEHKPLVLPASDSDTSCSDPASSAQGVALAAEATAVAQQMPGTTAHPAAMPAADPIPTPAVHHMTLPIHGHPSMSVPPGFVGMPSSSIPHGIAGQPIFIAVPMYMPPGQGVPSAQNPATGAAPAVATPAMPEISASVEPSSVESNASAVVADMLKKDPAMLPGARFPSMMTVPIPQFVTQALSSEGDEQPTHAVCA